MIRTSRLIAAGVARWRSRGVCGAQCGPTSPRVLPVAHDAGRESGEHRPHARAPGRIRVWVLGDRRARRSRLRRPVRPRVGALRGPLHAVRRDRLAARLRALGQGLRHRGGTRGARLRVRDARPRRNRRVRGRREHQVAPGDGEDRHDLRSRRRLRSPGASRRATRSGGTCSIVSQMALDGRRRQRNRTSCGADRLIRFRHQQGTGRTFGQRRDIDPHVVRRAAARRLGEERRDAGIGHRVGVARVRDSAASAAARAAALQSRAARAPRRGVPR